MSTERSRTILILVAIAAIAGGAGFWFFKIYSPSQTAKAAQTEVVAWETKWTAARTCLLGPSPASRKTSEALAIRELTPDPWDRAGCAALMAKLNRGEADDTGIDAVERAWATIDHAAIKAAGAFATHVASPIRANDPLPAALDELDAAHAALRAIVKLPAVVQRGPTLAAATLVPISVGSTQFDELGERAIPSAHGFILTAVASRQNYQVSLRTGTTPVVTQSNGVVHGAPDSTWGADLDGNKVEIGALDHNGVMMGAAGLVLDNPRIAAVIGTRAHGDVIVANAKQFVIAKVALQSADTPDQLVATAEPPTSSTDLHVAVDVDGRAAVTWQDGKLAHGRILKTMNGGVDEAKVELGMMEGPACLTNDRAWFSIGTAVVAFGGTKPVVQRTKLGYTLLGCTNDAALFRSDRKLAICQDDCRDVALPAGAPERSTVTTLGNKLIAITSHAGVVGVWREDAAPTFYALPELAEPLDLHDWPGMHEAAMAASNGEVIDVLARTSKGFVVIRIPAKQG